MGFGLLLLGYFVANLMAFNRLGGLFRLVGYIIILIASKKLSQYNRSFIFLMICSGVMIAFSTLLAFRDVTAFLYEYALIPTQIFPSVTSDIFNAIRTFFDLVYTAVLCFSIKSIAKDTGSVKIAVAAVRNFVFFCIYFVLQITVWVAYISNNAALMSFVSSTALPLWMVLVNVICVVLMCWMLFSCCSGICDSEEVLKEPDTSGISPFKRKK